MSDPRSNGGAPTPRTMCDAGMTLPELLIAITVLGLIIGVLSSAVVVTLRQQSSTEGRLNVARSEQSIGMWLPGDLASAGVVSVEPAWSPCGHIEVDGEWQATGEPCPSLGLPAGSNALMLGWSVQHADGTTTYTNVAYHFYQDADGTFSLARVQCVLSGGVWSCETMVVLRDLTPPPSGTEWVAGETRPTWVIEVSQPLAADATSETDLATGATKNAKRVIVTINGGGTTEGAGGGINRISITAGGTTRQVIDGSSMVGAPSFVEARSLCGGPITLIVDESNSIGSDGTYVKQGVRDFINALRGTPVKLQVVGFHTISHALGTSDWHRRGPNGSWGFDMANETDVAALLAAVDTLRFSWSGGSNGGTNWEEGLFRAFYTEAGLTAEPVPNKVVFFTDGIPTFDRLVHRTGQLPADPPDPGAGWDDSTGSSYSQVAFNRADFIARQFRGPIDLIGVGVGGIASGTEQWVSSPRVGYREAWFRAYRQYQRVETGTTYQKASELSTNLDVERASQNWWGTWSWSDTTPDDYFANNGSSHSSQGRDSDNRRINSNNNWRRSGWSEWQDVSYNRVRANLGLRSTLGLSTEWFRVDEWSGDQGEAAYLAASAAERAALWNVTGDVTSTTWVTKAEYDANNTTPDASDGWVALPAPEYVDTGSAVDWVEWTGSRNGISSQVRKEVIEGVPPYDGYRPVQSVSIDRTEILARLIGDAVPPTRGPDGEYNNAKQATLYTTPDWTQLPKALKAIALGDCGGTLTLQTRLGGSGAPDPFRYQATQQFDASGTALETDQPVVYTNREQTTGNFDLAIESGLHRDVVVMPENYADLRSYQPEGWSCRAGAETRGFDLVDIPGDESSPWKGIKVRVAANEAVSCILAVSR